MSRNFSSTGPKNDELRQILASDKRKFDVIDLKTKKVLYSNISYLETRELYDTDVNPFAELFYGDLIIKEK